MFGEDSNVFTYILAGIIGFVVGCAILYHVIRSAINNSVVGRRMEYIYYAVQNINKTLNPSDDDDQAEPNDGTGEEPESP